MMISHQNNMNSNTPTQSLPNDKTTQALDSEASFNQEKQALLHQPKKLVIILIITLLFLMVGIITYFIYFAPQKKVAGSDLETQTATDSAQNQKVKVKVLDVSTAQQDLPSMDNLAPKVEKTNSLSLVADKDLYQINDVIEVVVNLQATIEPDGVQFVILYDPELLVDVKLKSVNNFGSFVISEVDEQTGRIKAMLLKDPQETVDLGVDQPLLKITARVVQVGQVALTFDQGKTKMAAAAGQDVLKNVTNLNITVN